MHIQAAVFRNIQDVLRQDEPVCRNDHYVRLQRGELGNDLFAAGSGLDGREQAADVVPLEEHEHQDRDC